MVKAHTNSWDKGHPLSFWATAETVALLFATPFCLFPTTFPPLTITALVGLLLVWVAAVYRRQPCASTPLNLTLLLFGLTIIIGQLVTADPELTLPKATGLLLGLAAWRTITQYHSQRLAYVWVVYGLLGSGMVLLGLIAINWLDKLPVLRPLIQNWPTGLVRLPGASEGVQPNQLAATLLLLLPVAIGAWGQQQRPWVRWAMGTAALFLLALLFITQSRGGWLGGLAGLVALAWLISMFQCGRGRWLRWSIPAGLVSGLLLLLVWIGPTQLGELWLDPPNETAVGSFSSLGFRQDVWQWGVAAVHDFPFTGTGLGSFRAVIFRLYPTHINPNYNLGHAHNIFLQTALDLGLPGLVAYLALLGNIALMGWQAAYHQPAQRPIILGLLASLLALHVHGLLDALALGSKPSLLFWLQIALLTAYHHHHSVPLQTSIDNKVMSIDN